MLHAMSNPTSLAGLEQKTGIRFKNKDLLYQALTHRSAVQERAKNGHNERLEFLGDAVLQLVTTEYLFELTKKPEGELTSWRSALVQGEHLSEVARSLKLGDYLFLSKGEEASGGREKASTLADALEAFIGALYLDQGMDAVRPFVHQCILTKLQQLLAKGKHKDEKSKFQELAQEKTGITPTYQTLSEEGPDHAKIFTCGVFIGEEQIAVGEGNTKQKAEQDAAKKGLKAKGW
jgi:ribonuclease III